YFARLRQGAGTPLYLVIEKVLTPGEQLPTTWQIAGTTGYDFAALVNGLFVDSRAEAKMTYGYFAFLRERVDFEEIAYRSRRLIISVAVPSELGGVPGRPSRDAQADRA